MPTVSPITADNSKFSIDFVRACIARVERMQEQAHNEIEHLGEVTSFARELFLQIIDRLSKKPQLLVDQEVRLARDYALQRWFSSEFCGKLYSYSEHRGAVIAKKKDSDVIYFDRDDLNREFTQNELFSDAVEFLRSEGFIVVTRYKFKENHRLESHINPHNIIPVSAKLTDKGKQYLEIDANK